MTWKPTRQPILMSEWSPSGEPTAAYTTVMSWASYRPVRYRGQRYGQKDVEFRRFIRLPARGAGATFEVALNSTDHIAWQTGGDPVRRDHGASTAVAAAGHGGGTADESQAGTSSTPARRVRTWTDTAGSSNAPGQSGASPRTDTSRADRDGSAVDPPVISRRVDRWSSRTPGSVDVIPTGIGVLTFNTLDEATAAVDGS